MQEPTSARPNKFVQVSKQDDGFTAEAGKETFDVRLVVDTYFQRHCATLLRSQLGHAQIGN